MKLKNFKKGDIVRLHDIGRFVLVTKDSHVSDGSEIFSGVVVYGGDDTHPVGQHDNDCPAKMFVRVEMNYNISFKARRLNLV